MLKNLTSLTVSLFGAVVTSAATLPTPGFATSSNNPSKIEEIKSQETATKEVAPETSKVKRFICNGCNTNELTTLDFLQDRGITDKNALATIMGNIRQESTFVPNICEGGARTSYPNCGGGYGLIQWTNAPRFYGLGKHAASIGGNPSSLDTQLKFMLHEGDWKMIEPYMKTPGKTINQYMRLASRWIRWGHHGSRTSYAHDYANRFVLVQN
jgi:hypothetical protein